MAYNSYQAFAFNDAQEADPGPGAEAVPEAAPAPSPRPVDLSQVSAPPPPAEPQRDYGGSTPDLYDYASDPSWTGHRFNVPETVAHDPAAHQFASALHALGMEPELADGVLAWYDGGDHEHGRDDDADRDEAKAVLRSVWGADYDANVTAVSKWIRNNWPPEVARIAHSARLADGRAILNIPGVVMHLAYRAKEAPELPASTGNVEADIRALEEVMSRDPDAYARDQGTRMKLRFLYGQRIAKSSRPAK